MSITISFFDVGLRSVVDFKKTFPNVDLMNERDREKVPKDE